MAAAERNEEDDPSSSETEIESSIENVCYMCLHPSEKNGSYIQYEHSDAKTTKKDTAEKTYDLVKSLRAQVAQVQLTQQQ